MDLIQYLMLINLLKTPLGRLRIIAFLEGISFLLLIGIAMPLKYWADIPEGVRIIGAAHGGLFVLYVLLLIQVSLLHNWSFMKGILSFLASLVPFGTFYADAKWFK
jgi:integral membrane protein